MRHQITLPQVGHGDGIIRLFFDNLPQELPAPFDFFGVVLKASAHRRHPAAVAFDLAIF